MVNCCSHGRSVSSFVCAAAQGVVERRLIAAIERGQIDGVHRRVQSLFALGAAVFIGVHHRIGGQQSP